MASAPAFESPQPPGVSVVIPAYNYARFLPQAINSVLQQDYSPYEIVVVDDGSTDNTADVVAQYGQLVRCIYQTNAGLSAARNTGIRAARHDYVAFLDADDQWRPEFLRRVMGTFVHLPKEFVLVACYSLYIDAYGEVTDMKRLRPQRDEEITARDILLSTRFGSSGLVVKRAVFDQCGYFDTTLRSSEDRDMWMRIAARHRVWLLREPLALVRRHSGNMSKDADRMKGSVRRVIAKAYHARLVPRRDVCFWLRALSFHYFQNAWRYRDESRRGKALGELLISLLLWPFFPAPQEFNEPVLFRIRSLRRFFWELITGG